MRVGRAITNMRQSRDEATNKKKKMRSSEAGVEIFMRTANAMIYMTIYTKSIHVYEHRRLYGSSITRPRRLARPSRVRIYHLIILPSLYSQPKKQSAERWWISVYWLLYSEKNIQRFDFPTIFSISTTAKTNLFPKLKLWNFTILYCFEALSKTFKT